MPAICMLEIDRERPLMYLPGHGLSDSGNSLVAANGDAAWLLEDFVLDRS